MQEAAKEEFRKKVFNAVRFQQLASKTEKS